MVADAYPAVTRLDSLDLLRGLCALAVALYHFDLWGGLALPAAFDGILAVFGTYGVSVFFVLSGYSLAYAYGNKFGEGIAYAPLAKYARRRIGRLMPLFSAIVFASIIGRIISGGQLPDGLTIIGNVLLIFGFLDPTSTPVIGGWSIGLEVVFYVLFPLLVLFRRNVLMILSLSAFLAIWVETTLVQAGNLEQGWAAYVQPANHLIFFASGVVAHFAAPRLRSKRKYPLVVGIVAIMAAVAVISYDADAFSVVTGYRRVFLVPLSILLVVVASQITLSRSMRLCASVLGGASYPLYLIHPLVFFLAVKVIPLGSILYAALLLMILVVATGIDLLADKPLQQRIKAAGW